MYGKTHSANEMEFHEIMLSRSLRLMENKLKKTKYLCGDQISIADLSAAHELDMIKFLDFDLSKWSHVKAWLFDVIDSNPINLEICALNRKMAAAYV